MKKISVFFLFSIFFLILNNHKILYAKNKSEINFLGCNNEISKNFFSNYENLKIKNIEIDTKNYRNWTVNNIRIITSNTRFIPNYLKKKFKASIKVNYEDGTFCNLSGRIRHSGDAKDHIGLKNNSIIQSLDINLDYGNIKGITKFKLFKPDARGVLGDVVIQTQILRNLGYLAPRSAKVNVRVNETESIMLFQEKAAKELLEFNDRREGPILEGDQKYFFKLVQDIPDNNLSNWDVGTPFLRNKSMKVMLAKSTNPRVVNRGKVQKEIYLKSLNKLNLIYLYWANRFQDERNNFFFFDYDLDNELLGFFDKKNIIKLDKYNILMQATNSQHALGPDARKFYWNAVENYYEPINYDANPDIDSDKPSTTTVNFRLPTSKFYEQSFRELEKNLKDIDVQNLNNKISIHGLDLTEVELKNKVNKIIDNLKKIQISYFETVNDEIITHNKFKPIENILLKFNNVLNEIDPNAFLIKFDEKENRLKKCKVFLKECKNFTINGDQLTALLEGELKIDDTNYQYLGQNFDMKSLIENQGYEQKIELNNTSIFYEQGIDVQLDRDSKVIKINQNQAGAKIYFINGELKNYTIIYQGLDITNEENNFNLEDFPKNYPIDNLGLTGCLSFINIEVNKVNIQAKNSSCEDTVNFINSKGQVDNIKIQNSFSDALDVDFSEMSFNTISISRASNDCVDFSSGNYNLKNLRLENCGDKGLSIGEKSKINLEYIDVKNANVGVATKDSSVLHLKDATMNNLKTCVSAYNKKQEFFGGYVEMENLSCKNYFSKVDLDDLSKIFLNNVSLKKIKQSDYYNLNDLEVLKVKNKEIKKHFIKDYKALKKDGNINVVVEIPAGTTEKWEVSKLSGILSREFYMGKPRVINHTPYPVNYGMIPQTVLPVSRGGDGDPLDAIILGDALVKGEVVEVKPLGVMRMTDGGEQDDKIISVLTSSILSNYNNIEHLNNERPEILENIKNWFINYKGENVVKFINFESEEEASFLVKESNKYYKRFGLKERS
jgi:inorganic pyrophosphatase